MVDQTTEPQEVQQVTRRKKRQHVDGDGSMNINSMMDIMTILLVFLLISVTSDPLAVKENDVMKLSRSYASFPAFLSVPVAITKQEISVDQKKAVPVVCKLDGRTCTEQDYTNPNVRLSIDPMNKEHGKKDSLLIVPLKNALDKAVKQMKDDIANQPPEIVEKFKHNQGVATIICDQGIPYLMIAEIVYTTGMAELNDMRFAIIYAGASG